MVGPALDFQLSDEKAALIGRLIVTFAHIGNDLDYILSIMRYASGLLKDPTEAHEAHLELAQQTRIPPKIAELKTLAKLGPEERQYLVSEFRLAMVHVLKARNYLAHGSFVYPDSGETWLWSQMKLDHLPLDEVLEQEPWFNYAHHALQQLSFHLSGITPHRALPDRPA